jgi:hypothetical protein
MTTCTIVGATVRNPQQYMYAVDADNELYIFERHWHERKY